LTIGFDHDGVQFQWCEQAQYLQGIVEKALVEAEMLADIAAEEAS
jgi:hypothetical protein